MCAKGATMSADEVRDGVLQYAVSTQPVRILPREISVWDEWDCCEIQPLLPHLLGRLIGEYDRDGLVLISR